MLAPGEWDRASMVSNFGHNFGSGIYHQQTWFWVAYDDEPFYMAFKSPVIKPYVLRAKERHGAVPGDDCIEVFLSPADDGMEYVHVIANTLGAVFDAHVTQMGISSDTSFETGARAAAQVGEDSWTIEIEIPIHRSSVALGSAG